MLGFTCNATIYLSYLLDNTPQDTSLPVPNFLLREFHEKQTNDKITEKPRHRGVEKKSRIK